MEGCCGLCPSVQAATDGHSRLGRNGVGRRMAFTIGVFATVLDVTGRVLLVHRTDCDWWCQPGGGMESGETPWEGVIREVREETGFEVAVERLAGVYSWAPRKDEVIFSFVCRITGGAPATSE